MSKNKAISYIIVMLVLGGLAGYCLGLSQGIDRAIRISDVALSTPLKPEPVATVPDGSLIYRDSASGLSFAYPAALSTRYVTAADWPPTLRVSATPVSCQTTTAVSANQTQINQRRIGDREYCVETVSEGAAGSTYTTSTYSFDFAGQNVSIRFTLRTVRCENFDEPERSACAAEQKAFRPDDLASNLANSLKAEKE